MITVNDMGVPKNCDGVNYDAYCNNSRTTIMTNTLLVQEERGEPYRVICTVETRWSHCKPLLKGFSFDARKEKRGLLIYYVDEAGKLRKQLYTYVGEDKRGAGKCEGGESGEAGAPGSGAGTTACSID